MLLNSLYTIENISTEGDNVSATIVLNASHEIFEGHFPSQPVLPGVCMIEMLKDLLKSVKKRSCTLSQAHNIKYLKVVDPLQNGTLSFELKLTAGDNDSLTVSATSQFEDGSVNFKFKGVFV